MKFSHLGNPFAEESTELLSISSKVMANAEAVAAVTNAKDNGRAAYLAFIVERLQQRTKLLSDPMQIHHVALFSNQKKPPKTTKNLKLKAVKNNCGLFARILHRMSV